MKVTVALIVSVLVGCVTQETYDKLAAEHEETRANLRQREQALGAANKQLEELKVAADKTRADLEAAQKARAELESQLTMASSRRSQLEGSVEAMKRTLDELARRKEAAEARIAEFKGLLDRFRGLIDSGKLQVKIVGGKMVLRLPSDVLFGSGSASLSKEGKAAIAEVAGLLASIPERKFQIEGHTDNVPVTKGWQSNWQLASARSLTVLQTMVGAGMPNERISAAAYGDAQPAQANDTPEGKAANRRIEIVVVPDLSGLPGFEELNRMQEPGAAVSGDDAAPPPLEPAPASQTP